MEDTTGDQQTKSESKKSTGRQDGGPYSCTTTNISSVNNSNAKTLIEYDIDETLDVKEEIVPDQERHQWEKHNLLSETNQLNEKCITTEISSDSNSGAKILIKYEYDEGLEIKEETVKDHENIDQRPNKKYGSKLCTLVTRESKYMTVKEPRTSKTKKLNESKAKPENKYKCEKCARSYGHSHSLKKHKKFECNVTPQFSCEFCGKQFKDRSNMHKHILRMHQKTDSKMSQTRHNCDKCSRNYSCVNSLNRHKRLDHVGVRPQFICDFCGFQTERKYYLPQHIASRHSQKINSLIPQPDNKYKCENCARCYSQKCSLISHKKFECNVMPQFRCNFCLRQFKLRAGMNKHILRVHQKINSKASQTSHNCDKCSRSYCSLNALYQHKCLEYATVRSQFLCDFCGFQTKRKYYLSKHITSHHFQKMRVSIPKTEKKYKCEKCARSYTRKDVLNRHKKFKCDVMPQFKCDFCGKQFKDKSNMNKHILRMHQKTNSKVSQTRHNCDKCSRSYSCVDSLDRHKRVEHGGVSLQFICDFCGFQTKRKDNLSQHIASRHFKKFHVSITEPEKKYNCKKCARSFSQKKYLNYHKKYECNVIPQFSCEFCGKRFKAKGNRNAHVLRMHEKTNC